MRLAVALAGLLIAAPAFGQVRQNGTVSPGHPAMWTTTGIIQDAGTSAKGGLTTLGITAAGSTPFCINNGLTTGAYSAFCLGANPTSGNALLSVTAVNGATPMGLSFNMNGNLSSFSIGANGVPNIGSVSVSPLIVGTPPNNILTLNPGAASTNPITFNQSGTGGFSFNGGISLLGGALTWTDATLPRNFNQFSSWTGSSNPAAGAPTLLNRFQSNDQINYTGGQYVAGYNFEDDYGGGQGGKIALNVNLIQSLGPNTDSGADKFYIALQATAFGRATQPGSSPTNPIGRIFGFGANSAVQTGNTATNLFQVAGGEFDVAINSTSSSFVRSGVTIASLLVGGVQGFGVDNALWIYGQGAKWRYGLNFSDTQAWPIDDTVGTVIGAKYGDGRQSAPDMAAMWGVDFQQVAFPATGNPYDGGFFQTNGASLDGAGTLRLGTTYFTSGSTGLTIAAKGSVGTGAAIATAGSGYEGGNLVFGGAGAFGGLWVVTTSGGVPTGAVTELVHPAISSTSPPSNPITPTNLNPTSQGSGFQITETWNTTATAVSLQPAGGPILMAGLPTSAPTTHCQVWSNSGVLTLTTCP